MDDTMLDKNLIEENNVKEGSDSQASKSPKNGDAKRKIVSYRDKLLQFNENGYILESEEEDWITQQRREEEEEEVEDGVEPPEEEADPLCPAYQFSKADHKTRCKKWRSALIIKLLGKRLGTKFLMSRLLKLWTLVGTYDLIDLDSGLLLIKFYDQHDYNHVLHEGPWVVADHYPIVQRWRPFFDPYDDSIKRLVVWLRIPTLLIEFYSSHHLLRIGHLFGRTLKVDHNSIRKCEGGEEEIIDRARFAHICIEIDLRKNQVSKFKIGERVLQVACEGLHLVCFSYR